jgi:hypothetical protein
MSITPEDPSLQLTISESAREQTALAFAASLVRLTPHACSLVAADRSLYPMTQTDAQRALTLVHALVGPALTVLEDRNVAGMTQLVCERPAACERSVAAGKPIPAVTDLYHAAQVIEDTRSTLSAEDHS